MAPDVSTATGWKMKRRINSAYLAIFLTSAASATDPAASKTCIITQFLADVIDHPLFDKLFFFAIFSSSLYYAIKRKIIVFKFIKLLEISNHEKIFTLLNLNETCIYVYRT